MSSKSSCRNCGSFDVEVDPSRGDIVCTKCGIVLEDSVIVSEVQFEENAHGGSSAIGQFVPSDSKGGSLAVTGTFNYGLQKESKEITIQKAKNELHRMVQLLRINQHCFDTALNFYKMALNRNLTKGRRSSLVCAACLYIACRLDKTPHLLIDFSDILQVDPFTLGRTFTSITQDLYITLPLIDPCVYVLRYANQMKLGDKTHEVSTTAMRVLRRMKRDFLHCGRRPSGLCGSALIIAARFHNIPKKLKDIVNIVHIQETTLRKRLIEFGDTPSSSLTTDEFLTVDLGEEQDPPSFKTARLKDKERLQKYSDVEYEMKVKKLQRLIEKELEKKRNRGKRTYSMSSMESEAELSSIGSPANESEELLKDIIEDTLIADNEIDKLVAKSTVEIISDVCEKMKDEYQPEPSTSKGLGPTLETIGINSDTNQNEAHMSVDVKEVQHTDDKLNFNDAELNCMDDLDDEELDSYIVSEDEFKKKKKAWMELYAAYLEEQKKKEEERLLREKEEKKPESKKKKRPRKKSTGAATAGEAVEKVLREKKLSNKLNYDIINSLNVEDFMKSMTSDSSSQNKDSSNSSNPFEKFNIMAENNDVIKSANQVASPTKSEKVEVAQNDYDEDDYDEADDYEDGENEESQSVLKLSLGGDYQDEEDYDEYD